MHVARPSFYGSRLWRRRTLPPGTHRESNRYLLKCPSPDGNSQPGLLEAIENSGSSHGDFNGLPPTIRLLAAELWPLVARAGPGF